MGAGKQPKWRRKDLPHALQRMQTGFLRDMILLKLAFEQHSLHRAQKQEGLVLMLISSFKDKDFQWWSLDH